MYVNARVCCEGGAQGGNHGNKAPVLGEGNGSPVPYSCLENPMDRGTWWATAHGVAESWTQLKQLSTYSISGSGQISCWE